MEALPTHRSFFLPTYGSTSETCRRLQQHTKLNSFFMSVTIYDVAKKAGVGIGTVSRVINHSPQITVKTRDKVLAAIKALNYQPHIVAQSLARRKTQTIACIIPFLTGYFFVELLKGIQKKITEFQHDLILYSVDKAAKKENFLDRTLKERRVDGLILASLNISDEFVDKFIRQEFPIVLVDTFHEKLDSISVDNVMGAYYATKHLIDLGYRKIGMIDAKLDSFPAKYRLQGFKKALVESGLEFRPSYFVHCDFQEEADGFNKEAGYIAMKRLLELGEDMPQAVFVSSDIQAFGAIEAIKESGLLIPEDIALVGFDDIELAGYVGLTTMRQPIRRMGEIAVERLMEKITSAPTDIFNRRFISELIVRESCGEKLIHSPNV